MRTDEMVAQVRDQMLEFDVDPVTDRAILSRLNFGYEYCYNHLVKSNDSLYARWKYFIVSPGLSSYTLPKNLWGKRVEQLEAPNPPQTGFEPFNYTPIDRRDPQSMSRYDSPRARTLLPSVWTQIRNKLVIAPPPIVPSKLRYLVTEAIPPLAAVEGIILDFEGDKLTLDRDDTYLAANLAKRNFNFLSICDYMTGEVKAVYPYEAVGTYDDTLGERVITLGKAIGISEYFGQAITKCYSYAVSKVDYVVATKTVTITTTDTVEGIALGDTIEASLDVTEGDTYNIVDTLVDDTNFYDPPEYTIPVDTTTRRVVVTAISANSISWVDDTLVPTFVDRYPSPPGATFTINLAAAANGTYLTQPVVNVTLAAPHGLTVGRVTKITFAATADANLTGTLKCIPTGANTLVVLISALAGVWGGAGNATLYQYPALNVGTGFPAITELSSTNAAQLTLRASGSSPFAIAQKPAVTTNDPDAYDHDYDVAVGDVVVYGFGTGIPILPAPYHQILVEWASLVAKSALNETDAEVTAILKEMMVDLKGDTAGRKLGVMIQKDFSCRSNAISQSRRTGRR
jgi:hypothetical protein